MSDRAVERITEVAGRGNDVVTMFRELSELITPVVPNAMGPCCYTLDPASLLITSHFNPALHYELPEEMLRAEYFDEDVHDIASVGRSEAGVSTIHEAADGDPSASPRWIANMEMGGDQELLVALRTRAGVNWGSLGLYRPPGEAGFDATEIEFLRTVAPAIGEGLKRALLLGEAREPDGPDAPGLVVLTSGLEIDAITPGTEQWLDQLPGARYGGAIPASVGSVAKAALRAGSGAGPPEVALARVMSESGTWVVLHGAVLAGAAAEKRVAVIVEPAHPARITSLLMEAYGLTEREQEVTRHVLKGASTRVIAESLVISPHTVQEHLKNVFGKTDVRSRRELVGKVFFAHYEPRLRDNEKRVVDERPLRGGPIA